MAGVKPEDVNVAEVHDCFTVMGALGTEVIGKAEPGKGAHYWVEGKAAPGGECAINTSGGLIAKGHPIGATGIAMIGWSALQLLGKAPAGLQVQNPRAAATFNIGGPICASVCTVLRAAGSSILRPMSTSRRRFIETCALAPAILGATDKPGTKAPVIGAGKHTYEVDPRLGRTAASIKYGNTHGVVEDSQGHIYVHHTVHATSESADTMVVFDEKGKFVKSWGKEFKGGAHGLHIQKEGSTEYLYLCDTGARHRGEDHAQRRSRLHARLPGSVARRTSPAPTARSRSTAPPTSRSRRTAISTSAMATGPATSTSTTTRASTSAPSAARARRPASWIARTASSWTCAKVRPC